MNDRRFPDVPGGYPFPAQELDVLAFWQRERIFERSLEQTRDGAPFVFYEGPPTANNVPHVGHVLTRVVKDLFPRYQTMRGRHVARKGGWDTHGLPVEIEVEKSLGFSGKEQIEAYGIDRFNRTCLDSVHTYERQWRAMSERVGYWVDLDRPYLTYTNEYVESLWWALARLFDRDLLAKSYKIQPYCARCGTTLSSHEVAQNYKDVEDPSVWIGFPALPGQERETTDGERFGFDGVRFVAWTTTPWTLIANVALAVHPDLVYRVVEDPRTPGQRLLFGDTLDTAVPLVVERDGERQQLDLRTLPALARFDGATLANLRYRRPFEVAADVEHTGDETTFHEEGVTVDPRAHERRFSDATGWPLLAADYVTATDGTGLVHTAPMYGEDDHKTGEKHGLPGVFSVGLDGNVAAKPGLEAFAGQWFKDADPRIVKDLAARGFLLHSARHLHSYPFCWRCDRPLLYYAHLGWFIRTTRVREAMVAKNRTIGWHPEHVGEGRFGNWLENVVDWALSRKRYWGTPLPIWECDRCPATEVVGSYEELFEKAGRSLPEDRSRFYDRSFFDPHRPFVDRNAPANPFVWPCSRGCGGTMGRVEEVADAWFDSGAMPFAQHHYPFANQELFAAQFPADFISEAVDQTRGWFYTLHALGVLLFDDVAYRNCIVLGHVNDEQGRKMSKRLKNVVDPMVVIAEAGADALRWYFYVNNPEQPSRFSARLVREAAQRFLLPIWNALSFFTIYANLDGWHPGDQPAIPHGERPALDRWVLARLVRVTREVGERLDAYAPSEAARTLQELVDELTNWYIRRSRGRFWAGTAADAEAARDKESAYQTLYEVLATLARLLAPFVPFFAETLHRHLVRSQHGDAAVSVHLESWPAAAPEADGDAQLLAAMAALQRVVTLGHAARQSHALKTRQPLAAVTLVATDKGLPALIGPYLDILADELNVKAIRWAEDRTAYVRHRVTPVFPKLGPRFGKRMPLVKQVLLAADGDALAAELESSGGVTITLDGERHRLGAQEVEVRLEEREGVATQGDRELLLALDTALTPALVAEGLAREVVHRIQAARKDLGLDYADRIRVRYRADAELAAAIDAHRTWIAGETLASELVAVAEDAAAGLADAAVDEHPFALSVERVTITV